MAARFYIMPMILSNAIDTNRAATWHPKYVTSSLRWSAVDYGTERVCICRIADMSDEGHLAISANPDVLSIPENIDNNFTQGAVNVAQTFLESLNIPADWINTNKTYREVLKIVIGIFQFNQRWSALANGSSPFKEGLNLNTQYNQLNPAAQNRIRECFDSLNVDRSTLTATSTIREALKVFAQGFVLNNLTVVGEVL